MSDPGFIGDAWALADGCGISIEMADGHVILAIDDGIGVSGEGYAVPMSTADVERLRAACEAVLAAFRRAQ